MNAQLMGAGGFVSQTFLTLAQREGEAWWRWSGLPLEQMPGGKAFEQAYRDRYHTHIELHAPLRLRRHPGADRRHRTGRLGQSGRLPAETARHTLRGVTGAIAFDAQGNLQQPSFTLYRVVDGKWQPQTVLGGAKPQ